MTAVPVTPEQDRSIQLAGWYPDPHGDHLRWWDGNAWTDRVAALGPSMHLQDWSPLAAKSQARARLAAPALGLAWLAHHRPHLRPGRLAPRG